MATTSLRGSEIHTSGELPAVGSVAPDFCLVNSKLQDRTLADYRGKKRLLYIVPSLDTPVCATTSRRFDELATEMSETVVLIISADLPFAQGRFCGVEKLQQISALSMMRSRQFAKDYGVLLIDGPLAGITARAVIIIDEKDRVIYSELMADITDEPDYDQLMMVLK